jgi:DNA primase
MISQKSVQEIIETAKVEDVVSDFVSLKRRGINMIGNCPFHNEKTPSFTVSPQKNIYKCFGCGQAGNPVSFVMEHEGFSYPEALRYLAKKYGIPLEETGNREDNLKERQLIDSLYIVNDFAKKFYTKQLLETDLGRSIGLSYFKERGFREDIIEKFELGYAPEKGDSLTVAAVHQQYSLDILRKVGLANQYGKDFFRGRVMFPIRNLSGKVIGYGGRILDSRKKTAKYMNTPETEVYNKSKVLFGIYHAKKSIRQLDNCILVEGYTDVISLSQSGIENVVASSGTSLTQGQIALIKRYTPNITILYDGDAAGIKAALRGLDLVLEQGLNVKVVLLPEGEDPDSYVQKMGTTAFKEYLVNQSQDFILFKTNLMLKETANDPIKKAQLIKNIVGSIARIPDPIKRSVYVRECSNLMDMNEEVLINETNKIVHGLVKKSVQDEAPQPEEPIGVKMPEQTPSKVAKVKNDEFQEKDIIRILIEHGAEEVDENLTVAECVLSDMQDLLNDFENPVYQKFIRTYHTAFVTGKAFSQQDLLNHADADIQKLAVNMLSTEHNYSENWVNRYEKPLESRVVLKVYFKRDMLSSINRFKFKKIIKMHKENQERLKNIPMDNMEEMMRILKVQQRLIDIRGKLAELLKTVVLE